MKLRVELEFNDDWFSSEAEKDLFLNARPDQQDYWLRNKFKDLFDPKDIIIYREENKTDEKQ